MTFDISTVCDHSVFPDIVNDVVVGIGVGVCVTRPLVFEFFFVCSY